MFNDVHIESKIKTQKSENRVINFIFSFFFFFYVFFRYYVVVFFFALLLSRSLKNELT